MGGIIDEFTGQGDVDKQARRLENRRPVGIDAGGIRSNITGPKGNRRLRISASPERRELVGGIRDVLDTSADEFADLRVGADTPLSRLRASIDESNEAMLQRIADAERRTVGDLRQNLARRRVLGSSFAQDAIARGRAEFGRLLAEQEATAGERQAKAALTELDLKSNLIERETSLRAQSFQTSLDELNTQLQAGTQLATDATATFQKNARLRLQMAQEAASGKGAIIGEAIKGGVAAMVASDRRLKRDIVPIGHRAGLPLYLFRYLWSDVLHIGHMADEVRTVRPDAVMADAAGYLMVDYGKVWG